MRYWYDPEKIDRAPRPKSRPDMMVSQRLWLGVEVHASQKSEAGNRMLSAITMELVIALKVQVDSRLTGHKSLLRNDLAVLDASPGETPCSVVYKAAVADIVEARSNEEEVDADSDGDVREADLANG